MKYVMQDYNKLANIMDQPREAREQILTLQTDEQNLRYFISLIDLLATCAEVSLSLSLSLSLCLCVSLSVCLCLSASYIITQCLLAVLVMCSLCNLLTCDNH